MQPKPFLIGAAIAAAVAAWYDIASLQQVAKTFDIEVSARADGSFVETNSRNSFSREYEARRTQGASSLPMPKYHHIHLNSVDPDKSLDWYAKYWPAGRKETVAGFPAFHGGDLYLLYT